MPTPNQILIPPALLPSDGRFGSGPTKIRATQLAALTDPSQLVLGTSHRQAPVRNLVGHIRESLGAFFQLPDGYEIALGNGGSTAFWDIATLSLVERKAQHLVFGEFSAKFAQATTRAPFLEDSDLIEVAPGLVPAPIARPGVDTYAWPQNETSTGACAPVQRVVDADPDALMVIDATSAAGGLPIEIAQTDVYYFAPQKSFGSDGGLWFAVLSPRAIERIKRIAACGRWIPEFLSLDVALTNSRRNQTLNTPAVATLMLMSAQLDWFLAQGGLAWCTARCAKSSTLLYDWAEASDFATPFIVNPKARSGVVATIDFDDPVSAADVAAVLRANNIVDVDSYRKLGRNQLRIGVFPGVKPDDVAVLTRALDYTVKALSSNVN